MSFEAFAASFRSVTGPAQAFEIRIIIGPPMRLSLDVVNGCSSNNKPTAQAVLTHMIVTLQDARTSDIPLATIAALVPALASLVLLPSLIAVLLAISRTVSGGSRTSTLTTGAGD